MNAAELFLLASGLYAHDSGMAVGTDEIAYLRSGAKDIATSDAFTPLDDERERLADFADRHVLYWRSERSAFWESRWPQLLRRMSAVRTTRSSWFEWTMKSCPPCSTWTRRSPAVRRWFTKWPIAREDFVVSMILPARSRAISARRSIWSG